MSFCAECGFEECFEGGKKSANVNCPMSDRALTNKAAELFMLDENRDFYGNTLKVRHDFGGLCRMDETVAFCKYNGFKKVGLAYCAGMAKEGKIVNEILTANGFEVVSAVCKLGSFEAGEISDCADYLTEIPERKLNKPGKDIKPEGPSIVCDPIGQALLMNREKTEFNIVVGLCVGHDSLFMKYAEAMSTVLIAKDKPLNHNPAAALYYHKVHKKLNKAVN